MHEMPAKAIAALAVTALAVFAAVGFSAPPPDDAKKKEERRKVAMALDGKAAPAFKADFALNGKIAGVGDFKGKVVVLEFWALWCPYCVKSFKANNELHAKYKDKGVEVVGVTSYFENYAVDKKTGKVIGQAQRLTPVQERAAVKDLASFHKMEHRILFLPDREYVRVSEVYGRGSVPNYYILDKKGVVRHFQAGTSDDTAAFLGGVIDKLLKEE